MGQMLLLGYKFFKQFYTGNLEVTWYTPISLTMNICIYRFGNFYKIVCLE